jgi:antidote-toxin recognition MazE-like antitoxin
MAKSSKQKMSDYRERMRAKGLRPIQLWVPDLRDPERVARVRSEVRALRDHPSSRDGNRFLDAALAEIAGWEA